MSLPKFLYFVVIAQVLSVVLSCPPSKPPPCSWTTCRHEWRNNWNPNHPPTGVCITQGRSAAHIVSRHNRRGGCPAPQYCSNAVQHRRMCSCRNAYYCPFRQWTGWSGGVSAGTCGRQSRARDYQEGIRYLIRQNSCSGIQSSCGARQYDYRQWCSCRYATCSLQNWGSWSDLSSPISSDHCASQQRRRRYTLQWRYIERRDNCNGVGPQHCPGDLVETREKVVTCPRLSAPAHGTWGPDDCSNSPQVCKTVCRLQCDSRNGFQITGPNTRTCNTNGQWTTPWSTRCTDTRPPSLTCPNNFIVGNDAGKSTARVTIPRATATDNSGVAPTITNDAGAAVKDFAISSTPHTVKYTARDAAGNSVSCALRVTVKDTERPKVASCPDDVKVETNQDNERVSWTYPAFVDNNDMPPANSLRITSNRNPGILFPWGKHQVIYTAFDRANNNASCEFFVEVGPVKCPLFDAPQHGVRACNKKTQSSNGITYEMLCNVQCKKGYAFAENAANIYMCQSDGTWYVFDVFPKPVDDRKKRPWPDCGPEEGASSAVKKFTFYTGSCVGSEKEALDRIRKNFLDAIKKSPMTNYALCEVSQGLDCVVENVNVYCGSRSKRSGDPVQRIITFEFVINDTKPVSDRAQEAIKLTKMMKELDVLEGFLKSKFPVTANMPNLQIEAATSSAFCPTLKVLMVPKGPGSEIQRSICVECPIGTYFDKDARNCSSCPEGTYQDQLGQSSCKKCPAGRRSVEPGARNVTQCYDTCQPGEYSHMGAGGAVTCMACPIGTYQPKPLSKSCLRCPGGTTTKQVGAAALNDCK